MLFNTITSLVSSIFYFIYFAVTVPCVFDWFLIIHYIKFNLTALLIVCLHSLQVHLKVVCLKFGKCFKNLSEMCIAILKEAIMHLLDILDDKLVS